MLNKNRIIIKSPATVANLVCGFDVLGLALEEPGDRMEMRLLDEPKVVITSRDGFPLPTDPAQEYRRSAAFGDDGRIERAHWI